MTIELKFLDEVARDLPIIRPIKEFIHLNLLLPYQHLPFWEALMEVGHKLEAIPFPEIDYYRERFETGEIPLTLIEKKISELPDGIDKGKVYDHIIKNKFNFSHHDPRVGNLHDQWNDHIGVGVMQLADGMLIKWIGMFLDQGIGHWQMPGSGEKSFYQCIRDLLFESLVKPHPFEKHQIAELFPVEAELAIEKHLDYLCPNKELQKEYCSESIMTLRGWAGMIFTLQQNPTLLSFPRKITLTDFLAVKLVLERAWVITENRTGIPPHFINVNGMHFHPFNDVTLFTAFKICQEAMEESTYNKVLSEILTTKKQAVSGALYQATFCMDDRECSLRRHLESLDPLIETFGTAGHYGIECQYQHPEDPFPKKQCPAPMPVKYLLKEAYKDIKKRSLAAADLDHHHIQPSSNIIVDWAFSHFHAVFATFKLTTNLFFPLAFKNLENVRDISPDTLLILHRRKDETTETGLKVGYNLDEMAQVVFTQLEIIGFVHNLAPLIFFIGHGSTSANNPYFATYGCGACSGRPGSANARALAGMANIPAVRELIETRYKLKIPEGTYFVGGFHDTCKDVIELYEPEKIPAGLMASYKQFKSYLSLALYKNAKERCQGFKLVSYKPVVDKDAQKEVLRRSYSLFETRPELGHTNVTYAIVGRRKLTQGLHLNRRSFLQSYDRTIDLEGKLLAASLGAVIPVCSGINLDYFFSRVDNLRFGAGSKLPQNIVGNIGVSHGTESDLLFGLPVQMIDQHQPLRLLVLVEHSPEVALSAIQGNPLVRQIVYNSWIHYACYDEVTDKFYFFKDGEMLERAS